MTLAQKGMGLNGHVVYKLEDGLWLEGGWVYEVIFH